MRFFVDKTSKVIEEEIIPARHHWSRLISRGQILRITDLKGKQAVDFLCYNAANPAERYHAPNTIKKAGAILLGKGHVLYSDHANPLMTIVEDTFGGHDTIGGCCSAPSNKMLYGIQNPGCRENFLAALKPYGLGWRDIVPNVNLFMKVPVDPGGNAAIATGSSKPGDHVDLRAEMEVLAVISNCPQVLNPCNNFVPTDIQVTILKAEDGVSGKR
jgi:urea carboxylase-associated protein 1